MKTKQTKQKEVKVTNCVCCKKEIVKFARTIYCSSCRVHNWKFRDKMNALKNQVRTLRLKIYGAELGSQKGPMSEVRQALGQEMPWNVWNDHNAKSDCHRCGKFYSTKRLVRIKGVYLCSKCKRVRR